MMLLVDNEANHSKIVIDSDGNLVISTPDVLEAIATKSRTAEGAAQLRFPIPVSINILPAV